MHPVLFHAFGYPVSSYGFFLSLAHAVGILTLLLAARARRLPLGAVLDILVAVVIAGLVGARLGYAFNHWGEFRSDPAALLSLSKGGLSFFGGFPFAFAAFLLVLRWRRLPLLEVSDTVSPVLPFSLALARLGCFAKGCCHGAPTDVPWAVHYSHLGSKVPLPLLGLGLHPTQLYEAAFLLLLAALLWAALRFNLGRALKAPPGTIATLSIFAYSLFRLVGDSFRGDLARGFWGVSWMSPTQGAALLGVLATPLVLWICARAARSGEGSPS